MVDMVSVRRRWSRVPRIFRCRHAGPAVATARFASSRVARDRARQRRRSRRRAKNDGGLGGEIDGGATLVDVGAHLAAGLLVGDVAQQLVDGRVGARLVRRAIVGAGHPPLGELAREPRDEVLALDEGGDVRRKRHVRRATEAEAAGADAPGGLVVRLSAGDGPHDAADGGRR